MAWTKKSEVTTPSWTKKSEVTTPSWSVTAEVTTPNWTKAQGSLLTEDLNRILQEDSGGILFEGY